LSNTHSATYFEEVAAIASRIPTDAIENLAGELVALRERNGRLFFLGVGGSAGNCGHAVNDFRKLCGIESYAPTDNVSELTARTNDEGWETVFESWLRTSHLRPQDMVFVFSVGGGDLERNVSPNLVRAVHFAREAGARIVGVVGRDGGYTAKVADACVIVPTMNPSTVTPHTESLQAVVWHLLVSHPAIKNMPTKWESVSGDGEGRLCRS
jgi:D-sedoheptulose 7-phosphate isomerase